MTKETTSAGPPSLAFEHAALELPPERVLEGLYGMLRARMVDELPVSVEIRVADVTYKVRPLADIESGNESTAQAVRSYRDGRLT